MPRNPKDNWKFDGNFVAIGTIATEPLAELVQNFSDELWEEKVLKSYLSEYLDAVPLEHPNRARGLVLQCFREAQLQVVILHDLAKRCQRRARGCLGYGQWLDEHH